MILNTAPQAEAIMSNVGEIGEFRIRNSAKAFNILSSGLYANKIKAIIRELSCNAVDSHVAAGRGTVPFEVHLPTTLEPYFSIRDFGTGLNHEQVTSIYTTYFESTKTGSNDFIGALGLGSKSPFSYTDNFTVTAIKDGRKGIYTAFINEAGVPSIALMAEEQVTEPTGVEVKFSVNERYDFQKFVQEAQSVYQYFKLKPVIKGVTNFEIPKLNYADRDIIPGVHSYDSKYGGRRSRAVMGNIAYPIEVPNNALGSLKKLLDCGLELHFDIGELDFQASREGLSYIPQTIEAIRNKLEKLNVSLAGVLAQEANKISNEWKRSVFLYTKKRESLWSSAVEVYAKNSQFKLFDENDPYGREFHFDVGADDLKSKYNLCVRSFTKNSNVNTCSNNEPRHTTSYNKLPDGNVETVIYNYWQFDVTHRSFFVKNDTKVGASERAKFHWRNNKQSEYHNIVYVLEPFDKTKPAKFDEFLKSIHNPPEEQVMFASSLLEKPRAGGVGKNVSILKLEERTRRSSWRDNKYFAWTASKFGDLDPKQTYYYVPLKGYEMISTKNHSSSAHDLYEKMRATGIPELNVELYGVRKGDIESIKLQKNWINIEDHITNVLSNIPQSVVDGIVKKSIENVPFMLFGRKLMEKIDDKNPIKILHSRYENVKEVKLNEHAVTMLSYIYTKDSKFDPSKEVAKVRKECDNISTRYPLMDCLNSYTSKTYIEPLADYINMIDKVKGL